MTHKKYPAFKMIFRGGGLDKVAPLLLRDFLPSFCNCFYVSNCDNA